MMMTFISVLGCQCVVDSLKMHSCNIGAALPAIEGDFVSVGIGLAAGFLTRGSLRYHGEHAAAIGFETSGALPSAAMEDTRAVHFLHSGDGIAAAGACRVARAGENNANAPALREMNQ